ncbi:Beta-glucuronidase [Portunus trituberculatus]|uniref:Beta-glucuronidase n=1 Tax=Portunus trituberculatus TaxID=210409 RepID=A0A5B7CSU9_PORTR|nr:Beta-glucuronidase [Portunus trituberculatus]
MAEISSHLSFSQENLVTVAINNTLTPTTIPQGSIHFHNDPTRYPAGYFTQSYNFDFTNYAGIHRPVFLYTTPRIYIEDILLTTAVDGTSASLKIRGKGLDYPLVVKDFSLLKWLGANSFRTSHYPYAEEIMDMADQEGIMVVDECPAVGLSGFGEVLMNKHILVMRELVRRDKNRPSVIMWSVGNEPQSNQEAAANYFRSVVKATHEDDPTRPVTCVLNRGPIEFAVGDPDPAFTWSEEYQVELMLQNFEAFDKLRSQGFFVGEMIWNFADFATPQGSKRVAGNKKGVFTRNRQPKTAAHVLRWRYHSLAGTTQQLGNRTALWRHIFS